MLRKSVTPCVLNAVSARAVEPERRIMCWSIVRIPGRTSAIVRTSSYTFSSKEKNYPSAGSAGAASPKTRLNGEFAMESFSLNSAKSFLGRNVNLHLKDGAVIVNVQLTRIRKGEVGKCKLLEYVPYGNHKIAHIPIRNVAWAELLNLCFFQAAA
jgi:hypothetical protein